MNLTRGSILGSAVFLGLLFPMAASAFEIRPMTQNFDPAGRGASASFEVHNDLDEVAAVVMSIKARFIDEDGVETLTETPDFAVFPTEMMLKPKSFHVVRVKWLGDPDISAERSYRIIAEEVPLKQSKAQAAAGSGVQLDMRYGGTIYVAPANARPDVVVASVKKVDAPGGSVLELNFENRGNCHAIIDKPSVSVKAGMVTRRLTADLEKALSGSNIMVGGKRRIRLPWPADLPDAPLEAKLDASYLR